MFPATACLVQNNLGATHAWGFDLSAACSGFLYALTVGAQFVGAGTQKKALVIGSDVMTSILDYKDRTTCVLFGDGAGAVLLEPTDRDDEGILDFVHDVDGSGGKFLFMPGGGSLHPASHETVDQKMHYVHQEGAQVFKYAVRRMADLACEMLERNGYHEQGPGAGCAPSGQLADHSRHAGAPRRGRRKNHGEHRSLRKYDRREPFRSGCAMPSRRAGSKKGISSCSLRSVQDIRRVEFFFAGPTSRTFRRDLTACTGVRQIYIPRTWAAQTMLRSRCWSIRTAT